MSKWFSEKFHFELNSKMKILLFLTIFCVLVKRLNGQWYVFAADLQSSVLNALSTVIFPTYTEKTLDNNDTYDFIIVGASPSGIVLANRLTENPNVTVLLLENGEEPSPLIDIPLLAGPFGFTKYSYGYKTQPQEEFCRGCIDKAVNYLHGNALGGSTIINFMILSRGNRRDYDRWAAEDNPGWSYESLLPYFKKIEDCQLNVCDPEYRGKGGYITVSEVDFKSEIANAFVNACIQSGYNNVDTNGKEQIGVNYVQATTKGGKRISAEKGYLRPVRDRANLNILTKSKVTKILINADKTAYGVEYSTSNQLKKAYAKNEVLLAAGVLNSPQILMLSGIGPKKQLNLLDIPVIKDLPVGKKMYDHASFQLLAFQLNESITVNGDVQVINPFNYLDFLEGKGVFTSAGGVEAIGFVKTKVSTDPDPLYPDIELLMVGGGITSDNGVTFRKLFNVAPEIYDTMFKPYEGKNIYQVTPTLLHPKSYGSIKLKSINPFDPPLFYPNFFSDPDNHDVNTLIAAIREVQRINLSPALQRYDSKMLDIPVPGCDQEFDSDDYWECAIRTVIGSYWHMVATCKMGNVNDTEAVVNNEMKVYGIKNLRVVDTSIIPIPPSSHNMAPAYVIGEKAADLIRQFWKV